MKRIIVATSLALAAIVFAAPTSAQHITEVMLSGNITSGIPDLTFGPDGTYSKPGFPLLLPVSSSVANTLRHDGGSFTFGSSASAILLTYGDWEYNLGTDCGVSRTCPVNSTPGNESKGGAFAELTDVNLVAGTAMLRLTFSGARDFSNLVGVKHFFMAGDGFGTTIFAPEPSTVLLISLGLVGIGACTRRRSES